MSDDKTNKPAAPPPPAEAASGKPAKPRNKLDGLNLPPDTVIRLRSPDGSVSPALAKLLDKLRLK